MQGKKNTNSLLVGVQTSTAPLQISVGVPQNAEN